MCVMYNNRVELEGDLVFELPTPIDGVLQFLPVCCALVFRSRSWN